jgi:hypothetical protein
VPRSVVLSVGFLWGGSGTRTCGIFVGLPGGSRSRASGGLVPAAPEPGERSGRAGTGLLPGWYAAICGLPFVPSGATGGSAAIGEVGQDWARLVLSGVGHDAVVGAAGAGAAGAGAVAGEHLG